MHARSGFFRELIRREADDHGIRLTVKSGTEQGLVAGVQDVECPTEDHAHLADHLIDTI